MVNRKSKIAVVLGPGGLPGLDVHAGALQAIHEAGLRPTWLGGCSAGAIAAAYLATGHDAPAYTRLISGLDTRDVIRKRTLWRSRAMWLTHFCDPEPILELLRTHLASDFAYCQTPVEVAATHMGAETETAWQLNAGDLPLATLASMSIPGVFPYVDLDGRQLADGWPTLPLPLPLQPETFDLILCCVPTRQTPFRDRDSSILSRLLWTAEAIGQHRLRTLRGYYEQRYGERIIWLALDVGAGSSLQFDHALIDRAYGSAAMQLWGYRHQYEPHASPPEAAL